MTAHDSYPAATRPVAATLLVAAGCWAVSVMQMRGMDMGVGTTLGSFGFFLGVWTAMTAAMMLPGAATAVVSYSRTHRRAGTALVFLASYVAVWTLAGVAAYTVYRPHGTTAAAVVTIAAGLYELTPMKRRARQRCQQPVSSGVHLGAHCVVSTIGLMAVLLALGPMSIGWMAAVALAVLVQKLLPPRAWIDIPLALALIVLGITTL